MTPLREYTLAPPKQWDCVPFLWKCETRDIEGWKGAVQCPGLATAQAWDATCTQPRTSGSSATQALYHGPTALLKKYRGASHNHNANPDSSSPHRAQGHYLMSRVDTFTSWVKLNEFPNVICNANACGFSFLPSQSTKKDICRYLNSNIEFSPCPWQPWPFHSQSGELKNFWVSLQLLRTPPHIKQIA